MVQPDSRVGTISTSRAAARLCAIVAALGIGTAACSGSDGPRPRSGPTTTTLSVADQQVIQGWKAAEQAFYTAALTNDAASPALAETMADPALSQARQFLFSAKYDGYVGKGTFSLGHPHVVSLSDGTAVVESCVFGGVIEVEASTGKPAPPPFGVASQETVTSTLVQPVPGHWKISKNSVSEGKCAS